jgi:hypothetical protein
VDVAGFGDGALPPVRAAGIFALHQAEITH